MASRLCVVLQRKAAELAELAGPAVGEDAVVVEARSLDIEVPVLAEVHLEEELALGDLACAVEGHVRAVGEVDHYEDCR